MRKFHAPPGFIVGNGKLQTKLGFDMDKNYSHLRASCNTEYDFHINEALQMKNEIHV